MNQKIMDEAKRERGGATYQSYCPFCYQKQEESTYCLKDLHEKAPSSWPRFDVWFFKYSCFELKGHAPVCVLDRRTIKDEEYITKRALIRYAEWKGR